MNQIFRYLDMSKQSFHQKLDRQLHMQEQLRSMLPIIEQLRQEHPGMSVRQFYHILKPDHIGRDKFERFCFGYGYKLDRVRAYKRTTNSTGVIRFPNLLTGREATGVHQVWISDITYYQIGEGVFYLTFIMDLFSRIIVGYSVSKRLLTEETTIPALNMALNKYKPAPGLIFHSDGGGQYYCKEFLTITKSYSFSNSMCDSVFENPHAERVNGTIKNQYLKGYKPNCFSSLVTMTKRAVNNYNEVRPHKSLGNKTPYIFDQSRPAGGSLLSNDVFCSSCNPNQTVDKKTSFNNKVNLMNLKRKINKENGQRYLGK
jgi:putative transposase